MTTFTENMIASLMEFLNPYIYKQQDLVLNSLGIDLDMSIVNEGIRIKDKFISIIFDGQMNALKTKKENENTPTAQEYNYLPFYDKDGR